MRFMVAYRPATNKIIADKAFKLRKYKLNNDDWVVIEDLVGVLEVHHKLTDMINYITNSIF